MMKTTIVGILAAITLIGIRLPAWGQSTFTITGQPVLTLQPTDDLTSEARLALVEERWQGILSSAEAFAVSVNGPEDAPRILVNGTLLTDVTAADAEANSTTQPVALARLWTQQLQSLLNQTSIQTQLLRTAGIPGTLNLGGRTYRLSDADQPDLGRFVTDGTRHSEGLILYWEVSAQELGSLPHSQLLSFPDPTPDRLFVINRFRQFLVYEAI